MHVLLRVAASGMKNVFVLVHISRFQQIIGLFSLQASSETAKVGQSHTSFKINSLMKLPHDEGDMGSLAQMVKQVLGGPSLKTLGDMQKSGLSRTVGNLT
jgi:hypothetical protein